MASQLQLVIYEGFLAADPELHYTKTGKPVTNFRMGSNRTYKDSDGEQVKETTWLKVSVWGKYGEEVVNRYCVKGSHVIVEGRLRGGDNGSPTPYQLSSGDWAASFELVANNVHILSKSKNGDTPTEPVEDEGEVPF